MSRVARRGAGTMFKLGGQDPSAGFGSSWVERYIPGEYPGVQLVLNKEVVNKLLLFSTGHEPTRSHPSTTRPPHWPSGDRPFGLPAPGRVPARDGITVSTIIIPSPFKGNVTISIK